MTFRDYLIKIAIIREFLYIYHVNTQTYDGKVEFRNYDKLEISTTSSVLHKPLYLLSVSIIEILIQRI